MPILARAFVLIVFAMALVGGGLVGVARRRVGRTYDVRPVSIERATAPEEIERGGRLFRTNCLDCHAGAIAGTASADIAHTDRGPERRPIGGRVTGTPSFMGEIWAPNLTADPETGIGAWTDGEIARLLRNGIGRERRYAATMPRFARLADADIAALIGFLRSADPLVAPVRHSVPRPGLGVAGTLALAFAAGVDVRGEAHVPMPPRGRSAAYGRYLASAVYACVDCHTEGFTTTDDKLRSPVLLAGGQFHRTPNGETIYSTNLTSDPETGLTARTAAELERLLTTGIKKNGAASRPPMPVFRFIDADEAQALFAYLGSVPAVVRKTPGAPPADRPTGNAPPEVLFATLGCPICHGDRAPHRALLVQASVRPALEIAAAIRNPEARHPGSQMPTYASVLDEPTALRLANWIRATGGNPGR
jgi:mono/diheme cytochrome c family protein